uniref:Uncharacterized protein n=1 Tax=Daphnia magna TaxID=35525 RepID=A0A0P6BGW3_9CRUS
MGNDSLRLRSSCEDVGISPLNAQYQSPLPGSFFLSFCKENESHAKLFKQNVQRTYNARFKHFNLFTVRIRTQSMPHTCQDFLVRRDPKPLALTCLLGEPSKDYAWLLTNR